MKKDNGGIERSVEISPLRKRFIEDILARYPDTDVSVVNTKRYTNKFKSTITEGMWLGYQLFHVSTFGDKSEDPLVGSYIIANNVGPGPKVKTGYHPYIHRGKGGVLIEAERLAKSGTDGKFLIYRCVGLFDKNAITL